MPRFNQFTLAQVHTFVASPTTRVDLPRSGFITHLDHLLRMQVTAAAAATATEDGPSRVVSAYRIRAAGAKSFFDVNDGRLWHFWNMHRYLGQIHSDAVPTAVGTSTVRQTMPLHWGFDPLNLFDAKVVIPARDIQNLQSELVWGASADLGANQTIDNADFTLTVHEVALEPGETVAQFFTQGFLLPRFESRSTPITVQANLGFEDDVPVGDTLFQTLLLVLAAANTRSDAEASEVGVKFPKTRETPMQVQWQTKLKQARYLFSLPATLDPEKISEWKPMLTWSPRTMSPSLHERIVPRPRKTPSPSRIPWLVLPLASRRTRSSTTTSLPTWILAGWRSTRPCPNTTLRPQEPRMSG